MLIFGDCSLESGRPSSQLPVRTLLTRKRPFLVREFEFEVKPSDVVAVVILNLPFRVKEFEFDSRPPPEDA